MNTNFGTMSDQIDVYVTVRHTSGFYFESDEIIGVYKDYKNVINDVELHASNSCITVKSNKDVKSVFAIFYKTLDTSSLINMQQNKLVRVFTSNDEIKSFINKYTIMTKEGCFYIQEIKII